MKGLKSKANSYIFLADKEELVKTYHYMQSTSENNFLTVTSRRLILLETKPLSKNFRKSEIYLENIQGVKASYTKKSWITLAILFLVFAAISATLFCYYPVIDNPFKLPLDHIYQYAFMGGGAIFGIVAIILLVVFFLSGVASFNLELLSTGSTEFENLTSTKFRNFFQHGYKPTAECYDMLVELGALILDVKKHGINAAEKYFSAEDVVALEKEALKEDAERAKQEKLQELKEQKAKEKQDKEQWNNNKKANKKAGKNIPPSAQ